jgi:hypothetical protein
MCRQFPVNRKVGQICSGMKLPGLFVENALAFFVSYHFTWQISRRPAW